MRLFMIDEVSSVIMELDGVTRVLALEHGEDNSTTGWLDGNEISETNARRLYLAALGILQEGTTDADIPETPPEYRITVKLLSGEDDVLELYSISPTQFMLVHNGVNTGFFVYRMTLNQNLINALEILDRGEDLPM